MKPIDDNDRNSADTEFQKSLEELENIVKPTSTTPKRIPKPQTSNTASTKNSANTQKTDKSDKIDLAAWEDAVADIEQYFQEKAGANTISEVTAETPESENPN